MKKLPGTMLLSSKEMTDDETHIFLCTKFPGGCARTTTPARKTKTNVYARMRFNKWEDVLKINTIRFCWYNHKKSRFRGFEIK
jgi:hypothetical protein